MKMNLNKKLIPALTLAAASTLTLSACSDNTQTSNQSTASNEHSEKLSVSASFYPLVWLTEQIGGDAVEVTSVTPTNVEPHDFELSPKDVDSLSRAKLVVYVNGFQPSLDDALATIGATNAIDLAASVDLMKADASAADSHHHGEHEHGDDEHEHADGEHDHEHADGEHDHEHADGEHGDNEDHSHADDEHAHNHGELGLDPHFWLDPERMESAAEEIAQALEKASPEHKEDFEKNLAAVTATLDELDADFEKGLKECSLNTFVTSHSAFSYLAQRYGLEQASISGIDPEAEPSPAELAAIKEIVSRTGTTTIFTEELASPKVAEALAKETGTSISVLSPLESQPKSGDYISAMRANLTELQAAMQCK